MEERIAERWLL